MNENRVKGLKWILIKHKEWLLHLSQTQNNNNNNNNKK